MSETLATSCLKDWFWTKPVWFGPKKKSSSSKKPQCKGFHTLHLVECLQELNVLRTTRCWALSCLDMLVVLRTLTLYCLNVFQVCVVSL